MDVLTEASGYESWFVSARDPASDRALWIRHTRHRPVEGPESAALWCTAAGRDLGGPPVVIKEVFGAFPAGTSAGADGFRGQAVMDGQRARWDLAIAGDQAPLRPLRPAALYRAPLPRTKLEAVVPDGTVTGTLEIAGREVAVEGWRGTAGHNWGSEHADPRGGTRTVRHAALAGVTLSLRRRGQPELTLSSRRGADEYGTAQPVPGTEPRPLPAG